MFDFMSLSASASSHYFGGKWICSWSWFSFLVSILFGRIRTNALSHFIVRYYTQKLETRPKKKIFIFCDRLLTNKFLLRLSCVARNTISFLKKLINRHFSAQKLFIKMGFFLKTSFFIIGGRVLGVKTLKLFRQHKHSYRSFSFWRHASTC